MSPRLVISFLLSVPLILTANAAETPDEPRRIIDEIIVTAEKRAESILEVPVTMTAFNERLIEELGITSEDDLEQLVPGLQFGEEGESVGQGTVIRGIGSALSGETHSDLAVATYVDNVYTVRGMGISANLFDVERVEVARGPQGTLNGRNSIAGSVSYYTKKPTYEWDALVLSEFTDQFTQRYAVAFGGPISEQWAFRVNGSYYEGDGAQENKGFGDDYGAPDQRSIRPQLRFRNDRIDAVLRYSWFEDVGSPRTQLYLTDRRRDDPDIIPFFRYEEEVPSVANCPGTFVGTTFELCDDPENEVNFNRSGVNDSDREAWSLNVDIALTDTLTLRYTGSDGSTETFTSRDQDGTNRVGSPGDPTVSADAGVRYEDLDFRVNYTAEETSHEIQIISDFDGKLNFVAGLYYYENETDWRVFGFDGARLPFENMDPDLAVPGALPQIAGLLGVPVSALPFTTCQETLENVFRPIFGSAITPEQNPLEFITCEVFPTPGQYARFATAATSETYAAFGHVDYVINDKWSLSAGLRYTEDEKTSDENRIQFTFPFFGIPFRVNGDVVLAGQLQAGIDTEDTWDALIGSFAVEHTPWDDGLVYGRISTGYRAGGFQTYSPGAPTDTIDQEDLINYEFGFKGIFLDRIQVTTGVFYQDFDGYQLNATQPRPPGNLTPTSQTPNVEFTNNIDDTQIWGFEAEVVYHINERWRLSGFYAYTDSELGDHSQINRGDPNQQFSSEPFPRIDSNQNSFFFGTLVCDQAFLDLIAMFGLTDHPNPIASGSCFPELVTDVSGNQLPQQPKHKGALSVLHTMPTNNLGTFDFLATYSFTGERYPDVGNLDIFEIPSYSRLDLRTTWRSPKENLSVTLFVQNVMDDIGYIEFLPVSTNGETPATGTLTEPRQFGLQVRWRPAFD